MTHQDTWEIKVTIVIHIFHIQKPNRIQMEQVLKLLFSYNLISINPIITNIKHEIN